MITRARRFIGVLTIALVLGLAACGSSAGIQPSGPTRTVTDAFGEEVQVPVAPERIVVLSEPTLDGLIALGIKPVGAVSGRGQSSVPNYLAGQASDIELLGSIGQPNFEAIGAANPDLILVDGTSVNNNQPVIDALTHIAPVVYTGFAGGDWRENFRFVADAVNEAQAGQVIEAEYDALVEESKEQLTGVSDSTFSIVRWQGSSASTILKELLPGRALVDLGLQRPPSQDREGRGHSEPVSLENLREIDGDYMFFGTLGGASVSNPEAGGSTDLEGAQAALAEAVKVPGFTELEAYKQDRIILVDGSSWTSTGGPILMKQIVNDVVTAVGDQT